MEQSKTGAIARVALAITISLNASPPASQLTPVAIASLAPDTVIVLNKDTHLSIIVHGAVRQSTDRLAKTKLGGDLAICGAPPDQELLMVAYSNPETALSASAQRQMSPVLRFSIQNLKPKGTYIIPDSLPSSVACAGDGPVFVGGGDVSEVYTAPSAGTLKYFASIPAIHLMGAICVDPDSKTIFIADEFAGNVYRVDVVDKKKTLIASEMGIPSALAYDVARKRLYVTDANKHLVWAISDPARGKKPVKSAFIDSSHLSKPTAITALPDGTVWVGDAEQHEVLAFSPDGKLLTIVQ